MKGVMKVTVAVIMLVAMMFVMTSVTRAEEPASVNSVIDDRIQQTYAEYQYPTGGRMFNMPRWHEVRFDVHNGKFFQIYHLPFYGEGTPLEQEEKYFSMRVSFYTPDGQLFAVRDLRWLDKNRYISIPHNPCSPLVDRLIVNIQNRTNFNKDISFRVLDPVNPVLGTPMVDGRYRVLFR
jgi:hypothetical protein